MEKTVTSSEAVHRIFLRQIVRPERNFYLAAMLYSVAISLLTLAVPLSVQATINSVSNTALPQVLFAITLLLAVLLVLYVTMNALQLYVMELFERRFFLRVAAEVVDSRTQDSPGEIPSPFNRFFEVVTVQKSIPTIIVGGFSLFLQTMVGLVVVSFYHPVLLMFTLVLLLICYGSWRVWHNSALQAALRLSNEKYAVADYLENLEHGRLPAHRQTQRELAEKLSADYLRARQRYFRYSFSQTLSFLGIYVLANVGLLCLGGLLVIREQLTLGQLVAAELILSTILLGISKTGYYLSLFYDLCAGAIKLDGLLTSSQSLDEIDGRAGACRHIWSRIRVGKPIRLSTRLMVGSLAIAAVLLVCVPWVQTAPGMGRITSLHPEGQPQSIHALVKGRIKKWYVRDGSRVNKDDPILEVVDNDPLFLERLEAEANAARKGRDAAHAAAQTALLDLNRKRELFEQGIASRRDMEQARIEHESWLAKEAEAVAKITSAESRFSRQQVQIVRAPQDGLIIRTASGDAATMVSEGDIIATFVPANSQKAAELYVSGLDLPLIQPGRRVRLQFEGWPSVQFSGWPSTAIGTFAGEVAVVDPAISTNGKFRILVTETKEEPWPAENYLRFGAKVNGWVLLDTVSLGYELWRQMNNFPPENDLIRQQNGINK